MSVDITIDCLPVSYGDAIVVRCHRKNQRPWVMLFDTGPVTTWQTLRQRLLELPQQHGKAHIDLLVISHVDHDHIGAAHHLLQDSAIGIADVWFNGQDQLDGLNESRSIAEGQRFNDLLAFAVDASGIVPSVATLS